ncbi:hypothetical protein MMC34_003347 [Xylographa carneopallida]|nr:hypothetical protein [Xylographa carneopallida]
MSTSSSRNSDYEQSHQSSDEAVSSNLSNASTNEEESTDSGDHAIDKQRGHGSHGREPRGRYLRAYQLLLDESATIDAYNPHHEPDGRLRPSQHGLTLWSSLEKEKLFTSIERRGVDDLPGIAEFIASKSEPEIYAYLQLLKQATRMYHRYEPRPQPVGLFHVPATCEIGIECGIALDSVADAYLRKEKRLEEALEEDKHGSFWLLNDESAERLESLNIEDNSTDSMTDNTNILRSFELLDLQALLSVSSRVFMNSSIPEDNWRQIAELGQTPCLFATAFCDLHELVVGHTKRLISSALFFAMSRLRCSRSSNYHHANYVRKADVMAALDVLGLQHDSDEFWIESARRCKLDVYETLKVKNNSADRLSYDEVESYLRQSRSRSAGLSRVSRSRSPRKRWFEDTTELSTDVESVERDVDDIASSASVHDIASASSEDVAVTDAGRGKNAGSSRESSRDSQERYAELVDREQGQQEEQNLWTILKKEIPSDGRNDFERPIKRPKVSRKSEQELTDWRDTFEYKGEWEEYGLQRHGFRPMQRQSGRRGKETIVEHSSVSTASQRSVENPEGGGHEANLIGSE